MRSLRFFWTIAPNLGIEDEFKVRFSHKEFGEMINFKIINLILSQKLAGKK